MDFRRRMVRPSSGFPKRGLVGFLDTRNDSEGFRRKDCVSFSTNDDRYDLGDRLLFLSLASDPDV